MDRHGLLGTQTRVPTGRHGGPESVADMAYASAGRIGWTRWRGVGSKSDAVDQRL